MLLVKRNLNLLKINHQLLGPELGELETVVQAYLLEDQREAAGGRTWERWPAGGHSESPA